MLNLPRTEEGMRGQWEKPHKRKGQLKPESEMSTINVLAQPGPPGAPRKFLLATRWRAVGSLAVLQAHLAPADPPALGLALF